MRLRELRDVLQKEWEAAIEEEVRLRKEVGVVQTLVEKYEPIEPKVVAKKTHPRVATSGRKIWPVEDRKKIIEYAKTHSRKEAIEMFGCSNANLSYWVDLYVKKASGANPEGVVLLDVDDDPVPPGSTYSPSTSTSAITATQKLEIIKCSIAHGVKAAANQYSVSQEHIQDWRMTRKTIEKQAEAEK